MTRDLSGVIRIDISDSDFVKPVDSQQFIASIAYIPLETAPGASLSEVYKIMHYGNKYIFLDKHVASTVASFDSNGKFLLRYGSKGEMPGQYIIPMDFCIDKANNELLVLNSEQHFVNYYNIENGAFLRRKFYDFPARQLYRNDDGSMVFSGSGKEDKIIFAGENLRRKKSFIKYSLRYNTALINELQPIGDTALVFRMSRNDTLFRISHNHIHPWIILNFGGKKLTDEYYNNLSDLEKRRLSDYTTQFMSNIIMFAENRQTRLFSFDYQGKNFICLQDKTSGAKKIFPKNEFADKQFISTTFPMITGVDTEGNFLCLVSAEKLLASGKTDIINKAVRQSGLTAMSNPVLVKFTCKPF